MSLPTIFMQNINPYVPNAGSDGRTDGRTKRRLYTLWGAYQLKYQWRFMVVSKQKDIHRNKSDNIELYNRQHQHNLWNKNIRNSSEKRDRWQFRTKSR